MVQPIEPFTLSFNFIGVLYPDDLQDHHARNNELLLAVPSPYFGQSVLDLVIDFYNELVSTSTATLPIEFSDDTIIDAISGELAYLAHPDGCVWDFDGWEDCYAYAYLSW